jgi:hypothetical protein
MKCSELVKNGNSLQNIYTNKSNTTQIEQGNDKHAGDIDMTQDLGEEDEIYFYTSEDNNQQQ